VRRVAAVVAGAVLLAGCGIDTDTEPRVLAPERVPIGLLEEAAPPPVDPVLAAETESIRVYLVDADDRIRDVARRVSRPASVQKALDSMLEPVHPDDIDRNLRTAIPSGTSLQVQMMGDDSGEIVVNITGDLLDITGDALRRALAQIVYTATARGEVTRVRLLGDGSQRPFPDASGVVKRGAFTRADYRALQTDRRIID
jgi:spore germination protein GerM